MLMGYSWKSCVLYPRPIEFLIICTKKTNKYLTFYWTSNLYSVTLICNSAGRTFSAKVGCFGCRVKANCSLVGPGHIEEVPSVGIFLRDPSTYLRKFRRKPQKTRNGEVDKPDRGLNLALPFYQLWAQNRSATGKTRPQFGGIFISRWKSIRQIEVRVVEVWSLLRDVFMYCQRSVCYIETWAMQIRQLLRVIFMS